MSCNGIPDIDGVLAIGRGITADVYPWREGRVLKLFHAWVSAAVAEREHLTAQAVYACGYPVPAVYELAMVKGQIGIVFDRVHGISLLKAVERRPWTLFASAQQLAQLHAELHALKAPPGLPSHREEISNKVAGAQCFSPEERARVGHALSELPEGEALCHGDFHPENVLLSAAGPVVNEWNHGNRGHPIGDVTNTSVLFEVAD